MPKKQNFERMNDVHKNIGVPLIYPSGYEENNSTFKKERMLWKFRK